MNHVAQFTACRLFGAPLHGAQIVSDHIAKTRALAPELGRLVDQRRAEHGFEASHHTAGCAVDVSFDRFTADDDRTIDLVEDRTWNRRVPGFQHRERRDIAHNGPQRRVRRAEIEPAI